MLRFKDGSLTFVKMKHVLDTTHSEDIVNTEYHLISKIFCSVQFLFYVVNMINEFVSISISPTLVI